MGSSNDNLSNEEKFIIEFRIRHQWNKRTKTQLLFKLFIVTILTNWWRLDEADPFKGSCPHRPIHSDPLTPCSVHFLFAFCFFLDFCLFWKYGICCWLLASPWRTSAINLDRQDIFQSWAKIQLQSLGGGNAFVWIQSSSRLTFIGTQWMALNGAAVIIEPNSNLHL